MIKNLFIAIICLVCFVNLKSFANETSLALTQPVKGVEISAPTYNLAPYVAEIDKNLKSNWFPTSRGDNVEVTFNISSDGKYSNLRLTKPSSIKNNQAALDAVMFTAPFAPIPASANQIQVKYLFPGVKKFSKKNNNNHIQVLVKN